MGDMRRKEGALRSMKIRVPTEVEIVLLDEWAYYRDLDSHGCTLLHLETTCGPGGRELIVRLPGSGCA